MLELVVAVGVLGFLAAVCATVWFLRKIATVLEQVNRCLDQLQGFLFVRLPQPNLEALQRTRDAIISAARVDLEDVAHGLTGTLVSQDFPDSIRRLVDRTVMDAYQAAKQELGAQPPFDRNSTEQLEEFNDYYLLNFRSLMEDRLSLSGGILDGHSNSTRVRDVRNGPVQTNAGDVVIHERITLGSAGDIGPIADDETHKLIGRRNVLPVYFVRLITNEGPQPQGCFLTPGGAFVRALRLAEKPGRILTQRGNEWWVDLEV